MKTTPSGSPPAGPPPRAGRAEPPDAGADAPPAGLAGAVRARAEALLKQLSVPLLRVSLGVIFVWFGGLKLAGVTPVTELVAQTVPWLDSGWLVPALGGFEIAIGLALIVAFQLRWVCAAMVAHLGGTFLTMVTQPSTMFSSGNPLMLTIEGEFVAKNLVLITAGLVVAAWPGGRGSRRQARSLASAAT